MTSRRRSDLCALTALGASALLWGSMASRGLDQGAGFGEHADIAIAIARVDADRAQLAHRRTVLAKDIERLRLDPPDADLIDELAADLLGFGRSDERAIPADADARPATAALTSPQ